MSTKLPSEISVVSNELALYFFKQQLTNIPSYLRDTSQLTTILSNLHITEPDNTLLVTMDINAMYPSIPHEEGIQALLKHDVSLPFPKMVTTRLLNFILTENYFQFNKKFYKQAKGVAVGTPIAPTLANFYMHEIEQQFFTTRPLLPLVYKRYIDDIFIVWTHGTNAFLQFFHLTPSTQTSPSLKATHFLQSIS